jgi:hypothetical protein
MDPKGDVAAVFVRSPSLRTVPDAVAAAIQQLIAVEPAAVDRPRGITFRALARKCLGTPVIAAPAIIGAAAAGHIVRAVRPFGAGRDEKFASQALIAGTTFVVERALNRTGTRLTCEAAIITAARGPRAVHDVVARRRCCGRTGSAVRRHIFGTAGDRRYADPGPAFDRLGAALAKLLGIGAGVTGHLLADDAWARTEIDEHWRTAVRNRATGAACVGSRAAASVRSIVLVTGTSVNSPNRQSESRHNRKRQREPRTRHVAPHCDYRARRGCAARRHNLSHDFRLDACSGHHRDEHAMQRTTMLGLVALAGMASACGSGESDGPSSPTRSSPVMTRASPSADSAWQ